MMGVPVKGTEFVSLITAAANASSATYKGAFNISTAAPVLMKYATIYETYKIKSVAYRFIPDESDQASGNLSMGIDYGTAPSTFTRETIGKLTPHYSGPIRKTTPWIRVSPVYFNQNLVRYSADTSTASTPFNLLLVASCDPKSNSRTLGQLEISYVLEFIGLQP